MDIWPRVSELRLQSGCPKQRARTPHSCRLSPLVIFYWSPCFASSMLCFLSVLAQFNPRASCRSLAALPCPYNTHRVLGFNALSHMVRNSKSPFRGRIKRSSAVQDIGARRHWWSKRTWFLQMIYLTNTVNFPFLFFSFFFSSKQANTWRHSQAWGCVEGKADQWHNSN